MGNESILKKELVLEGDIIGTILTDAIPEELQPTIVELSIKALKNHSTDKDAATEIKNALEGNHSTEKGAHDDPKAREKKEKELKPYNEKGFGTWNVVVGHHFACSLTYED